MSGFTGIWNQFVQFLSSILEAIAGQLEFLGGHKWAAAIVVMTLAIRTLVLPLAVKQIKSMRETQRLQPEVQRLRQKYKNDRQRQMLEMQQLYQREGVNPYASCLPMLPQMPVLFAMFYVIRDLGEKAGEMPFLGLGDLAEKSTSSPAGWLLILVMTGASLITARQLNTGADERQRRIQMFMPLMFLVFFINVQAALVLYYTTTQLYQLVQQIIMTRDMRKPGSGWRGILGMKSAVLPPPKLDRPKDTKPQVKGPSSSPAGKAPPTFDALAKRRELDEKRARQRRKKKKRKR